MGGIAKGGGRVQWGRPDLCLATGGGGQGVPLGLPQDQAAHPPTHPPTQTPPYPPIGGGGGGFNGGVPKTPPFQAHLLCAPALANPPQLCTVATHDSPCVPRRSSVTGGHEHTVPPAPCPRCPPTTWHFPRPVAQPFHRQAPANPLIFPHPTQLQTPFLRHSGKRRQPGICLVTGGGGGGGDLIKKQTNANQS